MKIIKSHCKIVTNVCCAVALFLMIPIIIINTIFIVQIYILKEEVPNVCGYFPLISLEDALAGLGTSYDAVVVDEFTYRPDEMLKSVYYPKLS